ncbi:MAG: hypothetical protein KDE26_09690 [Bacteroidetes bacterium]|nr:hypothetical protein [Bacteroidota bacterium]
MIIIIAFLFPIILTYVSIPTERNSYSLPPQYSIISAATGGDTIYTDHL